MIAKRLQSLRALAPTNTHFDKEFDKVMLDMDKEKEKLADIWSITYLVSSALASYADDMSDQYNKIGFHSGKVKSLLNKIDRALTEYHEYTKKFLSLDLNAENLNRDFYKVKSWLDTFARVVVEKSEEEIKQDFNFKVKELNKASMSVRKHFELYHGLEVGKTYKVFNENESFDGIYKDISVGVYKDKAIYYEVNFYKIKKDGTASKSLISERMHLITEIK